METLSSRLIAEREAKGLTQDALAKQAKCSQTTVADIERGRNAESAKLPSIAAALGLHALWLKEGKGPKHINGTINDEGVYIHDPRIAAIAKTLLRCMEEGQDYIVEAAQKELDANLELAAKAEARAKANDC